MHGSTLTKGRFYWVPDIHAMSEKLGAYQRDIHMRKAGAIKALEDFKMTRKQIVASILSVSGFFMPNECCCDLTFVSVSRNVPIGTVLRMQLS
jgi:hypothetical protein